ALDHGADRVRLGEGQPRILLRLLEAQRDPALLLVDLEHLHVDFLRGADDLARVNVLLGPAHLRDVDQALDAGFQLDERAIFGDVGHPAAEHSADRIFGGRALPRVALQLLHAERNALSLAVDADDLHLHRVADVQDLGRVIDALVGNVSDVEQAVDPAEVDERAIIGDVLDDSVDDLALGQALDEAAALLGAGFLEDRAARHDDIAAAAVHLQNLERLRQVHQRLDVAHRADVNLRTGQEGDGAAEIDGEAALDPAEDHALDAVAGRELALELVPRGFAARAVARQHRFAGRIFDPIDIDLDLIADLELGLLARSCEFAQRDPALRLQADVDDGHVVLDARDGALHHLAFKGFVFAAEAFVEEGREIVAGRECRGRHGFECLSN